jgi:DNA-binding response OmpR family regulator
MSQRTVLVCEDEYLIRNDLSAFLRDAGYRVLEASDAESARSLFLAGENIDLLSTDVMMPGEQDGIALASWVREKYPHVRILVVTGWRKHYATARTFDGFIAKPYLVYDVVERINKLVPLPYAHVGSTLRQ